MVNRRKMNILNSPNEDSSAKTKHLYLNNNKIEGM